jgi:hypothetical protein
MGATYRKRGKRSWLVTVHAHGEREYKTVRSEADAKALVQYIHKQELAGVNVAEAMQKARATAAPAPTFPTLREALPVWIDVQVAAREFRGSTGEVYRTVLACWAFVHGLPDGRLLGDVPVNAVTREMLGAVITRVRGAGRSATLVTQIRSPLRGFYQHLIETKALPGPNPAADLKFFAGKRRKPCSADSFTQEQGPTLVAAAKALYPRWHAFILTGGAGRAALGRERRAVQERHRLGPGPHPRAAHRLRRRHARAVQEPPQPVRQGQHGPAARSRTAHRGDGHGRRPVRVEGRAAPVGLPEHGGPARGPPGVPGLRVEAAPGQGPS